jgi:hypothetical protein
MKTKAYQNIFSDNSQYDCIENLIFKDGNALIKQIEELTTGLKDILMPNFELLYKNSFSIEYIKYENNPCIALVLSNEDFNSHNKVLINQNNVVEYAILNIETLEANLNRTMYTKSLTDQANEFNLLCNSSCFFEEIEYKIASLKNNPILSFTTKMITDLDIQISRLEKDFIEHRTNF